MTHLMYVTTILLWGSAWFAISLNLGAVPSAVSVAYRFGLAALLLALFCWWRRLRLRFGWRSHLAMALQGIPMFAINYVLFYLAVGQIASGLVAIAYSTIVLMNVFLGALILKEPMRPRVITGGVIGITGVVCVFWPAIATFDPSSAGIRGLSLTLAGTFVSSLSQIVAAHNQRRGLPLLPTTAYAMAYGAAFTFLYCWYAGLPFRFDWSVRYLGSLLYLVVFASILGFSFYLSLIQRLGPDRAAYLGVLYPIVTLSFSTLFEGLVWTIRGGFGVALALGGNVLVLTRASRDAPGVPVGTMSCVNSRSEIR